MKIGKIEQENDRIVVRSLRAIAMYSAAGLLIVAMIAMRPGRVVAAEQSKTFSSPEAAVHAMVDALRKHDRPELAAIFGNDMEGTVDSGDPVRDKNLVEGFLRNYDQMHRFSHGRDGKLFLVVGVENWPMPIPLVKSSAGWYFDTAYGKKEIVFRRIGRNERRTIAVLSAIVAAEHEYYNQKHGKDATGQYAQKFLSDEGTHDGLYWKPAAGEPESPIGPLVAQAVRDVSRSSELPPTLNGYYFKILTKQGRDAPGGQRDYIVDGKMTGGFAVIAYPAVHGWSGVMSFLVGPDGKILQTDIGPKSLLAGNIDSYDPDKDWLPAQ